MAAKKQIKKQIVDPIEKMEENAGKASQGIKIDVEKVETERATEKRPLEAKKATTKSKPAEEKKMVAEKKPTAKTVAAKKPAAPKKKPAVKATIKASLYIQFGGKEIEANMIADRVKEAWTSMGNEVSSIKNLDIYVKPEENAAYYVVNGDISGKVEF